ncbi:MAG: hypothetical protein WCF10_09330 [Polyangiales bacterium]
MTHKKAKKGLLAPPDFSPDFESQVLDYFGIQTPLRINCGAELYQEHRAAVRPAGSTSSQRSPPPIEQRIPRTHEPAHAHRGEVQRQ